jgi:hypothetical protein
VVVEHRRRADPALAEAAAQAPIFTAQPRQEKPGRAASRLGVALLAQRERGPGQRRDGQPVPRRHDLVVAQRLRPARARLGQPRQRAVDPHPQRTGRHAEAAGHLGVRARRVQDRSALELPLRGDREPRGHRGRVLGADRLLDLGRGPCEGVALAVVPARRRAVGVGGRVEAALGRDHVAQEIVEHAARDVGQLGPPAGLVRLDVDRGKLRVVVQHLLEVRHQPARVGGVAVKAAAHVIADAAARHALEGEEHLLERAPIARPPVMAEQELEHRRLRELGGASEAAPLVVEDRRQLSHRAVHRLDAGDIAGPRRGDRRHLARESPGLRDQPRRLVAMQLARALEQLQEPVARQVGGAEERLPVGGEQHGHRPAAAAVHRLHRLHVDEVDVRSLLAVDLDAHVVLVEDARHLLVLERLALHHVAPVTGGVADREQDRLALAPRALERLVAPRVPVDRVVGVLEQVRAGLAHQPVDEARRAVGLEVTGARASPGAAAQEGAQLGVEHRAGHRHAGQDRIAFDRLLGPALLHALARASRRDERGPRDPDPPHG